MKHPFEVGMTADHVVEIAKKRKMFRVAKNEIIGVRSNRYIVKWHFEACSLVIGYDFPNPPYRVFEILEPLQTGKRLTQKQATPTAAEVKRAIQKLKENAESKN